MMTNLKQQLKISFRNVFRNRRRTILTLFILVLGSTGLTLVGGFFDYIIGSLGEYFIYSQTGHLQVSRDQYNDRGTSSPFKYMMNNVTDIEQAIEADDRVLFTVPRIKFGGMLSTRDANVSTLILGVDPTQESMMGSYNIMSSPAMQRPATKITAGRDLSADDPYGVLLGRGLMKALDLEVGDTVTLLITREFGMIDGADLHVRGEFTTLLKDFDDRVMKINLRTAQELFNVPDRIHSLLVILKDTAQTDVVKSKLLSSFQQNGDTLEVISWQEQAPYYNQSKDFLSKIYVTVQIIIGIVFFFSIANTINMNLFERLQEFGTMMALGNTRATIIQMIVFEGAILGILGAILGLGVGCAAAHIISAVGIVMPPPPMGTFDYLAVINLNIRILTQVFLVVLFSTLFASIVPAYRASHFRIVTALGHV